MNGCAFVWSEAQLLLSGHVEHQEDKSICHSGKKGMTSPDSPLLSEGLRLPVLGRSTEPKGSPACQWANLGHLHLWQRIRSAAAAERSLRSSVLQEERLMPAQHPGGGVTPRQLLFLAGETLVSIPN